MAESFKKNFSGIEYAFYRTTILDDITYYIMFDEKGSRNSVRVARIDGEWRLPDTVPKHINNNQPDLIRSIVENEVPQG
ncbi:MAG: hypothetical protein ACXWV0_10445 [Flavisolibacter sp.]